MLSELTSRAETVAFPAIAKTVVTIKPARAESTFAGIDDVSSEDS
jgi:hypothetical protein